MKYISLMLDSDHQGQLRQHPLAFRINEIMHDGLNNSCINFMDLTTLKNYLKPVNSVNFKRALRYLIQCGYLNERIYHGRKFLSIKNSPAN